MDVNDKKYIAAVQCVIAVHTQKIDEGSKFDAI